MTGSAESHTAHSCQSSGGGRDGTGTSAISVSVFPVDVIVNDRAYLFVTWLPDFRPGDLRVVVHEHDPAITGRPTRRPRVGIVVHRTCVPRGLSYCATVPVGVAVEHVEAILRDGMLTVRVPTR